MFVSLSEIWDVFLLLYIILNDVICIALKCRKNNNPLSHTNTSLITLVCKVCDVD